MFFRQEMFSTSPRFFHFCGLHQKLPVKYISWHSSFYNVAIGLFHCLSNHKHRCSASLPLHRNEMKCHCSISLTFVISILTWTNLLAFLISTHPRGHFTWNAWSRQAEVDSETILISTISESHLFSARLWLESQEAKNNREGAYTVLRCDLPVKSSVRIWGRDFHFHRLCESYSLLTRTTLDQVVLNTAISHSQQIIQYLLSDAQQSLMVSPQPRRRDDDVTYTIMLTLLWEESDDDENITIKGHAFSNDIPSNALEYDPSPISAAIAYSSKMHSHLPKRFENIPQAKLTSWCRRRRPLEVAFQVNGIEEVLLVRQCPGTKGDVEFLEGLTSNLFVIYRNGTLHTPNANILGGYARHLVLEAARRLGWNVECGPLYLSEMDSWAEVFCSSSIRLVIPVGEMWMPNNNQHDKVSEAPVTKIWTANSNEKHSRTWRQLYNNIILNNS